MTLVQISRVDIRSHAHVAYGLECLYNLVQCNGGGVVGKVVIGLGVR